MDFKKGDKVFIMDYPFGKPLNIRATIVGKVNEDYYNVIIENGICEGDIVKYKYWKLFPIDKIA